MQSLSVQTQILPGPVVGAGDTEVAPKPIILMPHTEIGKETRRGETPGSPLQGTEGCGSLRFPQGYPYGSC